MCVCVCVCVWEGGVSPLYPGEAPDQVTVFCFCNHFYIFTNSIQTIAVVIMTFYDFKPPSDGEQNRNESEFVAFTEEEIGILLLWIIMS